MSSLRNRLLLAMLAVAGVTLALAALVSTRVVTTEVREFARVPIEANAPPDTGEAVRSLEEYYSRAKNWDGIVATLAQISAKTNRRVLIVDVASRFVAIAPESLAKTRVEFGPDDALTIEATSAGGVQKAQFVGPPRAALRDSGGAEIGTMYLLPRSEAKELESAAPRIVTPRAILWRLVPALIAILLLAMAATYLVSRQILLPLESMRKAVDEMRGGNLAQRVDVKSRDEIGELASAFNDMAANLARVEQARRDMIGDAAHELRTPLTNIRCQLEAVQDGLAAANAQTVASLHDEVMLLGRLVDDLRDLALADAGQLAMSREMVSMEEVIRGAASSIAPRAKSANVAMQISVAEKLPLISGDAARLAQVLRNLLENALAHSPSGGTIVIEALATGKELLVSVRDSGPGIPAEHLPRIFERFYRTDPSRSRESGGAGLGLAIVRQIVNAHSGRVWAENLATGGAIFFVALPIIFSECEHDRER